MDYQSNSHNFKEAQKKQEGSKPPEKKIEAVSSGTVKKKSELRKLTEIFLPDDVSDVKTYILIDVVIPAVKNLISDVVNKGTDMLLFGGNGGSSGKSLASKVSYGGYFNKNKSSAVKNLTGSGGRRGLDYDDILFKTRAEAEAVLSSMDEIMDVYELVRVSDLYDLANVTGSHTLYNYGWTDIRSATVVRVRDGYIIKMPRALPID